MVAIGLWGSAFESLRQVGDSSETELQQRLDQISLRSAILALYGLQDLSDSNEAVACVGVGFIVRPSAIRVGIVVK